MSSLYWDGETQQDTNGWYDQYAYYYNMVLLADSAMHWQRHNSSVNMGFADGHVDGKKFAEFLEHTHSSADRDF